MYPITYHRFKRQRKGEYSSHKKRVPERGNTPAPCDTHNRGGGSGRTDDIEIETFSAETEQPQDTVTEETDNYYFRDPTTIGKNIHSFLHRKKCMYVFSNVAVPGFDSILIERFPEYVRDMMQKKEDKVKAEFKVVFFHMCVLLSYIYMSEL